MSNAHILIVEDEPLLQEILKENLEEVGYQISVADSGEMAWSLLSSNPQIFDVVILDRVMPGLDGIEVLRRIKAHDALNSIPVIMQTSLTSDEDIAEGLKAGALYYLTKPFSAEALLAIVSHSVQDRRASLALQDEVRKTGATFKLLQSAIFEFRTREEARALATLGAHAAPDPQRVVLGLSELLLNAVEHGNLAITYQEKSQFLSDGSFEQQISSRLSGKDTGGRVATLTIQRFADSLLFTVEDEGNGFDWNKYLEMSPDRAFDMHGRGIAMAKMLSFDELQYQGKGNVVVGKVLLREQA
jgi:DNA-binding response OmpR family regulator